SLFTHPPPPHPYTLSLHDALPIFAPSTSVMSGGPAIDPGFTYAFTNAGLVVLFGVGAVLLGIALLTLAIAGRAAPTWVRALNALDRKSTRLNSSHLVISYAVFCLK